MRRKDKKYAWLLVFFYLQPLWRKLSLLGRSIQTRNAPHDNLTLPKISRLYILPQYLANLTHPYLLPQYLANLTHSYILPQYLANLTQPTGTKQATIFSRNTSLYQHIVYGRFRNVRTLLRVFTVFMCKKLCVKVPASRHFFQYGHLIS